MPPIGCLLSSAWSGRKDDPFSLTSALLMIFNPCSLPWRGSVMRSNQITTATTALQVLKVPTRTGKSATSILPGAATHSPARARRWPPERALPPAVSRLPARSPCRRFKMILRDGLLIDPRLSQASRPGSIASLRCQSAADLPILVGLFGRVGVRRFQYGLVHQSLSQIIIF
jgi:hypothetical protein